MTDVCELCDGNGYRIETAGQLASASLCTCSRHCPKCGDTGFVVRDVGGRKEAELCDCRHLADRIRLFNACGIPSKFAGRWIEDYNDQHRSQKEVKYALLKYRDEYQVGDPGILLWGEPGVGKTHLICGLLSYLTLERGIAARFVDIMHLMMELKKAYSEHRWDTEVVAPLIETDVLVIDELGKGKCSEWELAILDQLISTRYNSGKTLHCTTNYPPEGAPRNQIEAAVGFNPAGRPFESLRDRVGDRIFSRLNEMCTFFHIEGEDWRRRGQKRLGIKRKRSSGGKE